MNRVTVGKFMQFHEMQTFYFCDKSIRAAVVNGLNSLWHSNNYCTCLSCVSLYSIYNMVTVLGDFGEWKYTSKKL